MNIKELFKINSNGLGENYSVVMLEKVTLDENVIRTQYTTLADGFSSRGEADIWLFNYLKDVKLKEFIS